MRNVIQITDNILGVIVDEKYTRFMIDEIDFYQGQFLFAAKEKGSYCVIKSFDDKHKIHGTCTLPLFELDFIYGTGSYDTMVLKKRIKKSINDLGLYAVNPVKLMDGKNISCEEEAEAYHKNMMAFVEAESKTVKKLLLIEKI